MGTPKTVRCKLPTVWDSLDISLATITIHAVSGNRSLDRFKIRLAQLISESFSDEMVRIEVTKSKLTE